jgi:hypothetical protein
MLRYVVLITLLLCVFGCSRPQTVVIHLPSQDLYLALYGDHEHISGNCKLAPDSTQFRQLSELLAGIQNNWRTRHGAFGPSVEVIGPGVKLDFRDDLVALDYGEAKYQTMIPRDSYSFLSCHGA